MAFTRRLRPVAGSGAACSTCQGRTASTAAAGLRWRARGVAGAHSGTKGARAGPVQAQAPIRLVRGGAVAGGGARAAARVGAGGAGRGGRGSEARIYRKGGGRIGVRTEVTQCSEFGSAGARSGRPMAIGISYV